MNERELLTLIRTPGESVESIAARLATNTPADRAAAVAVLSALSGAGSPALSISELERITAIRTCLHGEATRVRADVDASTARSRTQVRSDSSEAAPGSEYRTTGSAVTRRGGALHSGSQHTLMRRPPGGGEEPVLGEGAVVHDWYRLEQLLGVGAMGQVWKAKDLQRERANDPQPHVALKLVSADFAQHDAAMVAMAREAKKAQELAHPNIATVYVFAVDPGTGHAYLAMELLDGQPLDRLVAGHPTGLRRDRALDIIRGLARGLAYAHSKGIVHCDFKPGNAFVTDAGVAKVLDFGIARLANEVARMGDSFDAGALNALTPPYASFEMLANEPPLPHPSDDVYALGLVAYELLSGRHPFGGADAREVQAEGRRATPLKGLKRHEWRAIERALRLTRTERWPDARAFLKALEGTSPWVPALATAATALALVAAYSGYQNYLESKPRVPFDQLPTDVRASFADAMRLGDYAYRFGTSDLHGGEAARAIYQDAVGAYAEAYALHPKNELADDALRRSLEFLADHRNELDALQRAEARATLEQYRSQYQVLAKYEPLERIIGQLAD